MAETKRTSQEITTEFNNLAFKAGHLQFEINEKSNDLKVVNETLRGLALEYNAVKAAETAEVAAKAAADAKSKEERQD